MTEGDCGATLLRAARDADAADIIELIAAAYAEYPGCVLDIEADMPELKAPARSYAARNARRGALGGRLLDLVEAVAAARQAGVITLWSDTRFEAAHAFYVARGFRRTGLCRLDDAGLSVEYRFRKDL